MNQYSIAIIVGSLRADSINRKLANSICALAPPDFAFTQLEIGDLPLYNQDDDANQAPAVKRLKQAVAMASGLVFVTPEYNRGIPGVLKNAIDHASRPYGESAWTGKPTGILGASVGTIGTAVAQQQLRTVLAALDVPTLGLPEVFIQVKKGFFDESGKVASAETQAFLQDWMNRYVAWVKKFAA